MATYIPQKAEDSVAAGGDLGVPILGVTNEALTTRAAANDDYSMIAVDSVGRVLISGTVAVTEPVSIDDNAGSITVDQSTASNLNAQVVGNVAHDSADSGVPVKVGAKAESSPAGITLVADADRTDLYADLDGLLMVKGLTAFGDIKSDRVADTGGTSTAFTNLNATASVRNYVTTIVIYNTSATDGYVDFRDGTGGSVIFTAPAPKGSGCVISLPVPLRQPTTNTALAYDVSAALTTVYISVVGFQSKV